MDNQETPANIGNTKTQDEDNQSTTQKTKKMSNMDQKPGVREVFSYIYN